MIVNDLFEGRGSFDIGDPVIITGDVEFRGKTGDVREIGRDGSFVVVDLYNYGPQSFQATDVSYNDYADSDDEAEYQQSVAEGQTPEQEIERLKLRQNAEHGGASLKRQAATQSRIRELEKQIKDKKGVAEGFADEFAKFAQERGGKLRTGPQPTKPATVPAAQPTEPINRAALEQELKQLSAQLDPNYEYSDDYSFWSKQKAIADRIAGIKKKLGVTETKDEKIAGRYDADEFDSMVNRLKKLAGAGPLKTVWDPAKRVYKNVPTAVQPKK